MRIDEVLIDRTALESLAERIAAKYKANQYQEFETEMLNLMPSLRGYHVNLEQLFDLYNPERQQDGARVWARMIKEPEKYINSK